MKYQFIQEQREKYPVRVLCQVLEVSESGYYAWGKCQSKEPNRRQEADAELTTQLERSFEQSRQTYGSPRIHAALPGKGVSCSRR